MKRFAILLFFLFATAVPAFSQNCSPFMGVGAVQFEDNSGLPLTNGALYVFSAGTSTQAPSYSDSQCSVLNVNPVTFTTGGRATIWINTSSFFKYVGETVMASPAKDTTYRFSVYVETRPSQGCEYDSSADVVLSWTRITPGPKTPQGMSGWQRYRVTIDKSGQAQGQLLLGALFVAKAETRVSYHTEYSAGRGCSPRPSYQVFPVLEQITEMEQQQ